MVTLAIEHIVSDPNKHRGKPYIAGKGITVQHVATLHNEGWTVEALVEEFDLTPGQVHAALSHYFDHKAEIDEAIRQAEELAQQSGRKFEDVKREILSRQQPD